MNGGAGRVSIAKSCGPLRNSEQNKEEVALRQAPGKMLNQKLPIIREETVAQYRQSSQAPLYTEIGGGIKKSIRVYVDKDVEFNVEISNDQLTCGWLLSEVTRKYTDELNRIKKDREYAYM